MTPEETLKTQRSASGLIGTRWICLWLIAASALLGIANSISAIKSHESVLGALASPLSLIAILLLLRSECQQKLERVRSSLR